MWNANGILIQGMDEETNYIKNFKYQGINAYYQFPLSCFDDKVCKALTKEQRSKEIERDQYLSLEFISNSDLYERYIRKCIEMGIEFRALFIESQYANEIWHGEVPQKEFIGYEYCPIPIDEQIITDFDWYVPFSKYWKNLNKYGLFDNYTHATEFIREYNHEFLAGKIGDGEMDAYLCRVFLICI